MRTGIIKIIDLRDFQANDILHRPMSTNPELKQKNGKKTPEETVFIRAHVGNNVDQYRKTIG